MAVKSEPHLVPVLGHHIELERYRLFKLSGWSRYACLCGWRAWVDRRISSSKLHVWHVADLPPTSREQLP